MDYLRHNRMYWDEEARRGGKWSEPVSQAVIAGARRGEWAVLLTPIRPVPRQWFPDPLAGREVLCLACGGGQQGPVLAAAGARVTVLDNSPGQLAQDEAVAAREGLNLGTELGDMRDLARFPDGSFDLVFHPVSNCYVPDILPVWREAYRVLRAGGALLAGFANPVQYTLDLREALGGKLVIRHRIPYSDLRDLSEAELKELVLDSHMGICFGHSLADQIGGQLEAGFVLGGFYEDNSGGVDPLDAYIDTWGATRAVKGGEVG